MRCDERVPRGKHAVRAKSAAVMLYDMFVVLCNTYRPILQQMGYEIHPLYNLLYNFSRRYYPKILVFHDHF